MDGVNPPTFFLTEFAGSTPEGAPGPYSPASRFAKPIDPMPITFKDEVIGMDFKTKHRSSSLADKKARVRRMIDRATEDLAEALERGQSDTLRRYLVLMARFHRYSSGNLLLVWSQRPDATQVAGFNTWKEMGRSVRKGEKGIAILAPIIRRKTVWDGGEKDERIYGFKTAYVFDLKQTEGKDLPQFAKVKGDPGQFLRRLREGVIKTGIRWEYSESIGAALGMSKGGSILIRKGLETAEEFSVLVHEFAHELLHQSREENRPSRTVRETEAEAVAFVVCQAIGLDTNSASSDYIQLYNGKKATLLESLARIQKTAQKILGGLLLDSKDHGTSDG